MALPPNCYITKLRMTCRSICRHNIGYSIVSNSLKATDMTVALTRLGATDDPPPSYGLRQPPLRILSGVSLQAASALARHSSRYANDPASSRSWSVLRILDILISDTICQWLTHIRWRSPSVSRAGQQLPRAAAAPTIGIVTPRDAPVPPVPDDDPGCAPETLAPPQPLARAHGDQPAKRYKICKALAKLSWRTDRAAWLLRP